MINNLTVANDSSVLVSNAESQVTINQVDFNENGRLSLGGTGALNDALKGDLNAVADRFTVDPSASENIRHVLQEGVVMGEVTFDTNGGLVEKENVSNEAKVERMANLTTAVTRVELNDLRKRLGDVRAAGDAPGAWARYNGGAFSGDKGFDADFHMIQVGGDTLLTKNWRLGAAFTYSHMDADDRLGSAKADTYSLAGYGVWQGDNGLFVDTILRAAQVSSEMKDASGSGDVDNLLFSLSGEVGMRFDLGQFYVEPAAEVTYTYIDGDSYTIGNTVREFESTDSLMTRLGATFGMVLPQKMGDVYLRAGVVNECLGDFEMTSRINDLTRKADASVDGTWYEMAVGANLHLNERAHVYADVERTEGGDLDEDWRANLGVRVNF